MKKVVGVIGGAAPVEFIFVPSILAPDVSGIGESIEPDGCYIELYLESLGLERARVFATRFQAVAYSFVTLVREGQENAKFTVVSKPQKLAELDKTL